MCALQCTYMYQHCVFMLFLAIFIWLLSILYKGLRTSTSLIVIESEIKDSPVEVVKSDKFRWAISYQLRMYTTTFEYGNLYPFTANTESTCHRHYVLINDQGLCDTCISQPKIITCSKGCAGIIHQLLPTNPIHIML